MLKRKRSWLILLAVCVVAFAAACGGKNKKDRDIGLADTGTDTQTDTGMGGETGMGDTGMPGCQQDQDCNADQVCNTETNECVECVGNGDCDGANMVCTNNTCMQQEVECESAGDDCDPSDNRPPGEGFACVETGMGTKCVGLYAAENTCKAARVCLGANEPVPKDPNNKGLCLRAQCSGPLDSAACDGIENNVFFSNLSGNAKCARVVNGETEANICAPSGTSAVDEACTDTFCQPGDPDCQACQAGLKCIDQVCETVCQADGDCSESNETCMGLDDSDVVRQGYGFCGEKCDAYSRGQCSKQDEGCHPLDNDKGFCRPSTDKGYGLTQASSCETNSDCKEGYVCAGICVPACKPPPPDKEGQFEYDNTCRGEMSARFVFLGAGGSGPSKIDVYFDEGRVADDLQVGDATDGDPSAPPAAEWMAVTPGLGETPVEIVGGSAMNTMNPVVEGSYKLTSGDASTWSVYPTDSGPALHQVPATRFLPDLGQNQAAMRVVHEVTGLSQNVDIVAAPTSGGTTDLSSGVELAVDVKLEDVGAFKAVELGDYALYVFPNGAQRQEGNELAKIDTVTLDADNASVFLYGDAGDQVEAWVGSYPVPPHTVAFTCLNPSGAAEPEGASGYCLEGCTRDDYGRANCTQVSTGGLVGGRAPLSCTPLGVAGEQHACTANPSDSEASLGDSCSSRADCPAGSFCDTGGGSGQGTCVSYCVGGDSDDNPNLQCGQNTVCGAADGEFGQCQFECTPNSKSDLTDSNCPTGKKNCFPSYFDSNGDAVDAFCRDSGGISMGQTCGNTSNISPGRPLQQNCQPGTLCAQPRGWKTGFQASLIGMWLVRGQASGQCRPYDPIEPNPTCRQTCDPFKDGGSGCPSGQACATDLALYGSAAVGVCIEKAQSAEGQETGARCDASDAGRACGDHSICVINSGSGLCYQTCLNDGDCTGANQKCNAEEEGAIGICSEPMEE